jgi:signal transduction histidine kinase
MGITCSVPENILRNSADGGQLPPFGQVFLECDRQGRILWMSEHARARLGDACNLRDGLPAAPHLVGFLLDQGHQSTLTGIFHRIGRPPVPVEMSCVMRSAGRLLLSVELRERAADQIARNADPLAALQSRTLANYFRLLRTQQALDSRLERGRGNPAAMISEQLERERARLARELHTGAGQLLSAIKVHVELIESKAPELPPEIRGYLDRIAQLARDAAAEISAVSRRLHPLDWQAMGLVEALRKLWHASGIPERFQGSLHLADLPAEPPHPVRVALYRIAQEAISNVIRHADATRLSLTLDEQAGPITLRIEDNGKGFDTGRPDSGGIGLRAIRDQVRNLDGDLQMTSGAAGTTLEVRIPLESCDE